MILVALVVFAPSVLLPEWRAYQELYRARALEARRAEAMQETVNRQRSRIEALKNDPAVLVRLGRRDLGIPHSGDRMVAVDAPQEAKDVSLALPIEPPALPSVVASFVALVPAFNYDAVYCDEQTRTVVMAMCLAMIAVALWMGSSATAKRARAAGADS